MILNIKEKESARRFLEVVNGFIVTWGHREEMEAAQAVITAAVLEVKNATAHQLYPELGALQVRVARMLGEIEQKTRPLFELMEKTNAAMKELVMAARPDVVELEGPLGTLLHFEDEILKEWEDEQGPTAEEMQKWIQGKTPDELEQWLNSYDPNKYVIYLKVTGKPDGSWIESVHVGTLEEWHTVNHPDAAEVELLYHFTAPESQVQAVAENWYKRWLHPRKATILNFVSTTDIGAVFKANQEVMAPKPPEAEEKPTKATDPENPFLRTARQAQILKDIDEKFFSWLDTAALDFAARAVPIKIADLVRSYRAHIGESNKIVSPKAKAAAIGFLEQWEANTPRFNPLTEEKAGEFLFVDNFDLPF